MLGTPTRTSDTIYRPSTHFWSACSPGPLKTRDVCRGFSEGACTVDTSGAAALSTAAADDAGFAAAAAAAGFAAVAEEVAAEGAVVTAAAAAAEGFTVGGVAIVVIGTTTGFAGFSGTGGGFAFAVVGDRGLLCTRRVMEVTC